MVSTEVNRRRWITQCRVDGRRPAKCGVALLQAHIGMRRVHASQCTSESACVKIVCLHARSVPPKFGRVKRPLPKHAVPDAPWRTCASDGELGGVANLLGSCSVTTDPQEARLLREFSTTTFFSFFFSKMCAVPGCKVEKLQTLYLCKVHRHPVS